MIDGANTRAAFNLYLETQLAPTLQRSDIVILDNLSIHNSARAAETLKARGVVPVPSAILTDPQSDRDDLLKAQGTPVRGARLEADCVEQERRRSSSHEAERAVS